MTIFFHMWQICSRNIFISAILHTKQKHTVKYHLNTFDFAKINYNRFRYSHKILGRTTMTIDMTIAVDVSCMTAEIHAAITAIAIQQIHPVNAKTICNPKTLGEGRE